MAKVELALRGQVIEPGDAEYDEARKVHNAMSDRKPRAIVRPNSCEDVAMAVNCAREHSIDLAIRGGGHSVPGFGTCDDGIVVDLSSMRGVVVAPTNKTAKVQGGATWGDFNTAANE